MADYSSYIAKASAKLAAKGMPMVYVSVTEGTEYDPNTGSYPEVKVRTDFVGLRTQPTVDEVQGGIFAAASTIVLMAGDAVDAVDTSDYLEFLGRKWDVKAFRIIAPAEKVILYKLQIADGGSLEANNGRD